jgi:hypothetical protein
MSDLLHVAKTAFSQAKGTLDAAAARALQEIGETYLKSAAAAGLHLAPSPEEQAAPEASRPDGTSMSGPAG